MATEEIARLGTEILVRIASAQTNIIGARLSLRSLPIPVKKSDGVRVTFFYCPLEFQPDGQAKIKPPSYLIYLHANGVFERIFRVTSPDLGQHIDADEVIGAFEIPEIIKPAKNVEDESEDECDSVSSKKSYEDAIKDKLQDLYNRYLRAEFLSVFLLPEGMTVDQYLINMDRLYAIYDKLIPEFLSGKLRVSDEIRACVNEYKELFSMLNAPCLSLYYRAFGKDFFQWLDNISHC